MAECEAECKPAFDAGTRWPAVTRFQPDLKGSNQPVRPRDTDRRRLRDRDRCLYCRHLPGCGRFAVLDFWNAYDYYAHLGRSGGPEPFEERKFPCLLGQSTQPAPSGGEHSGHSSGAEPVFDSRP